MNAERTIVVGIDGAHFEMIDPWIRDGGLTNIKSLIKEGVSSDLRSCLPPVTSPNWKCYSSGLNPGKLGIYWWENIDVANQRVYYPESRKSHPNELWDYLSRAGYFVCSVGTPLTYPPKEVNGILVAGGPDCPDKGYTHPPELEAELRSEYGYRVHPDVSISSNREEAAKDIHDLLETRFEAGLALMADQEFDFVQLTTFYINVLQHHFWNDEPTKRGWEIIDHYVGEIRDRNPDANIVLMSDHGANKLDVVFNVNTLLAEHSYLAYRWRYRVLAALSKLGVTRQNIRAITDRLGITSILKRTIPGSAIETVPFDSAEIKQEAKTEHVDWRRSRAIASGQGPVYAIDPAAVPELESELAQMEDFEGSPLFENVYYRDEIYDGEYLDEAPDLILDQMPNVHIRGSIGRDAVFEKPSDTGWRAENKKIGLFVGAGPDIDGPVPEQISILDLCPTILKLYDVDRPAKLDGEALDF